MLGLFGNTVIAEPVVELKKGAEYVSADGTTTDAAVETAVRGVLEGMLAALQAR